jgi:hypothetical protein
MLLGSVFEKQGDIFLKLNDGKTIRLTNDGKNSQPNLSPNKSKVVFVKDPSGVPLPANPAMELQAKEIFVYDLSSRKQKRIVAGRYSEKPEENLTGFKSPQFSIDSKSIYFMSAAWAVSGAVHMVNLETRKIKFICPGNSLEVILKGKYKGYLIVSKHKYFLGGGSYDWYWLVDSNGKEVGPVGEELRYFKDLYIK